VVDRKVTLMDPQFDRCVNFVIDQLEGGGTVVTDSGGVTRWGISSRAHPGLDVAHMTRDQAVALYESDYWLAAGCERLDFPMSLVVFQAAVNQGVALAKNLAAGAMDYIEALWDCVLHYSEIAEKNHSERQYLRGWINRLVKVYKEAQRG
jgi:hypothetical protein